MKDEAIDKAVDSLIDSDNIEEMALHLGKDVNFFRDDTVEVSIVAGGDERDKSDTVTTKRKVRMKVSKADDKSMTLVPIK